MEKKGVIKLVQFSKIEVRDLSVTIVVITLLFAYLSSGNGSLSLFLTLIPLSFITVGLSFVLHELAHKISAQKYGFYAEFRKWNLGLLLAVITSFLGFVFLAPGAVYISSFNGEVTDKQNGIISVAGPLTNIVLAVIFMLISIAVKPFVPVNVTVALYVMLICTIGFSVNAFLAFFNMLPFPVFDGSKVFKWNRHVWFITMAASVILVYLSQTIQFI